MDSAQSTAQLIVYAVALLFCVIIDIYILVAYKKKVWSIKPTLSQLQPRPQPLANQNEFLEGLCGCMSNPNICLSVYFCHVCRSVDTQVTAGVVARDDAMKQALFQACCACIYIPFMHPCKRAAVRAELGGSPNWTCMDLLVSWYCFACVLCQEAREVDKAANAETRFPACALTQYGSQQPIGQSIQVNP